MQVPIGLKTDAMAVHSTIVSSASCITMMPDMRSMSTMHTSEMPSSLDEQMAISTPIQNIQVSCIYITLFKACLEPMTEIKNCK